MFEQLPDDAESALAGVRVVELTDWIAGPHAGSLLADFGADVVRVESPGRLDHARRIGGLADGGDRSASFAAMARNKRSVGLDLATPAGREVLRELLGGADVLVTNRRISSLERHGLAPPELVESFPQLIVLVISGFGMTGPLHERGAVDRVAQAFGGLTYLTGDPDRPPTRSGLPVADFMAGWVGAFGVVTALYERVRSGRGQVVDLGLYEPIVAMMPDLLVAFDRRGVVAERTGNVVAAVAPGGTFRTSDGRWMQISASSDPLFQALMCALGRPELAEDDRLATAALRHAAHDELMDVIAGWVSTRTSVEVAAALDPAGVPCAPVNTVADLLRDEHVIRRGTVVPFEDRELGTIPVVAPRPLLTRTPGRVRSAGPHHGEHTEDVLRERLDYSAEHIAALEAAATISCWAGLA